MTNIYGQSLGLKELDKKGRVRPNFRVQGVEEKHNAINTAKYLLLLPLSSGGRDRSDCLDDE